MLQENSRLVRCIPGECCSEGYFMEVWVDVHPAVFWEAKEMMIIELCTGAWTNPLAVIVTSFRQHKT